MVLTALTITPATVSSSADPTITVSSATSIIGGTATIEVSMKNNPGIAAFILNVDYDSTRLTLTNVAPGPDLGGQFSFTGKAAWVSGSDVTADVKIMTLTFAVKSDAVPGNAYVTVSYTPGNISNSEEEDVDFLIDAGRIEVVELVPCDINGDGVVNSKDLTRFLKYLSGADVTVNEGVIDVNGDGAVNSKDLTRLLKYLSGATVEVFPKVDGNNNNNGTNSIIYNDLRGTTTDNPDTYQTKTGVAELNDPIGDSGYEFLGWYTAPSGGTRMTDIPAGSGDVILYAHWGTPKTYSITYDMGEYTQDVAGHILSYDCYYATNSPRNPDTYTFGKKVNLYAAEFDRLVFKGWIDETGAPVGSIPEGRKGDIVLTATWELNINQAMPNNRVYDECEYDYDEEKETYSFIYYLGRIQNAVLEQGSYIEKYNDTVTLTFKEIKSESVADAINTVTSETENWQKKFSSSGGITLDSILNFSAGFDDSWGGSTTHMTGDLNTTIDTTSSETQTTYEIKNGPRGWYVQALLAELDVYAVIQYHARTNSFSTVTVTKICAPNPYGIVFSPLSSSINNQPCVLEFDPSEVMEQVTEDLISILESRSNGIAVSFDRNDKRISVDLSDCQESGSLNNASFPWMSRSVFTVYPTLGNAEFESVSITGAYDRYDNLIDSFSLRLSEKFERNNVQILLNNVGVKGCIDCGDFGNVTMFYRGSNEIREQNGSLSEPVRIAISADRLSLISSDDLSVLSVYGGNGDNGSFPWTQGIDGSPAIICSDLTLDGSGKITIVGGNGGNGNIGILGLVAGLYGGTAGNGGVGIKADYICFESGEINIIGGRGGNGGNGNQGVRPTDYDDCFATRNATGNGANGKNGGTGGAGGTGGKGGFGVEAETVVSKCNTVTIKGGDSGNGGKGGKGGTGGTGQESGGWACKAGNGGNGGTGGKGGDAYYGVSAIMINDVSSSVFDNIHLISGETGTVGKGGAKGDAGPGGHHSANGNHGQVLTWGDNGHNGNDGFPGDDGVLIQ